MFHTITISRINRLTPQAVAISFDIPEDLREEFLYKPGQYITLKVNINGTSYNRAYSLCSSSFAGEQLTIGVKQTEHGLVSTFLNQQLAVGDTLQILKPMGNFFATIDPSHAKNYVLIGGGSGITPLLSIAKSVLLQEPQSCVTLLYGNRDAESIMFKNDIEQLQSTYTAFTCIHVLEHGESTYVGRLDSEFLSNVLKDQASNTTSEFFICGPAPVMANAESVLESFDVSRERIHREYFTAPITADDEQAIVPSEDESIEHSIDVKLYGKSFTIQVEPGETILEAGIRQQLDPPYACQIAACCTCRAKLRSGKVRMDSREALTDSEIEEGYILTCQAHPLTNDVLVDFDG